MKDFAIVLAFSLVFICACLGTPRRPATSDSGVLPAVVLVNGQQAVVFSAESARALTALGQANEYWSPSLGDVSAAEAGLREFLHHATSDPEQNAYVAGELSKILQHHDQFHRQYVGIVSDGSRRILINSFPAMEPDGSDAHRYWKESFVVVNDGGFWYWTVLYDPQRGTYTDLRVNGYA